MPRKHSLASLKKIAKKIRKKASAPYSKFKVGAALEVTGGKVFSGYNVENISYGLTSCAERNDVFSLLIRLRNNTPQRGS